MITQEAIDRAIALAVSDAEQRSPRIVASPSWLDDEAWTEAQLLVRRTGGPLSSQEMVAYVERHDRFAKRHFLDLVYEIERLYEIVRLQSLKLAGGSVV